MGTEFFASMEKNGTISLVTRLCNVVGLMTIGAMATSMVKMNLAWELNLSGNILNLQSVIDSILPQALPVGLTLLMFKYLKKDVKPMTLMCILIVVGIVSSYFGIM